MVIHSRYKVAGIRLGEHNTVTDPDCENNFCGEPVQDFKPAQIVVHKNYNDPPFKNDIAIIRLSRPADYNGESKAALSCTRFLLYSV